MKIKSEMLTGTSVACADNLFICTRNLKFNVTSQLCPCRLHSTYFRGHGSALRNGRSTKVCLCSKPVTGGKSQGSGKLQRKVFDLTLVDNFLSFHVQVQLRVSLRDIIGVNYAKGPKTSEKNLPP